MHDATVRNLRLLVEGRGSVQLDRYEVDELIGEGGMGAVYRAHDRALGRDVAIKIGRAIEGAADDAARILEEAHVLALLEHPGIVPIHDVGRLPDGRAYYVMKLIRGAPLEAHVRRLPLPERLRLFRQACDAVGFAHAAGVIHRDLKPANIMIGDFGEVLVVDWGVAMANGQATDEVAGTPAYMAPEQRTPVLGPATPRTDVYGLGGVLAFLLTDHHPAERIAWGHTPRPLRSIVDRARAIDPARRYASAAELGADVDAWRDRLPVRAHRETAGEQIARLFRRHQVAILLVGAYLLMRLTFLAMQP